MCIGDVNPWVRAFPELVSGIIFLISAILLHILPFTKKLDKRLVNILKIVIIIIGLLLIISAANKELTITPAYQLTYKWKC